MIDNKMRGESRWESAADGRRRGESDQGGPPEVSGKVATTVLHVGGMNCATEKAVVERVLGRRSGVQRVEANPVAQTATVTFDASQTSVAQLRRWVEACGFHCAEPSVPTHLCDPMEKPDPADAVHAGHMATASAVALPTMEGHAGQASAAGHGGQKLADRAAFWCGPERSTGSSECRR